MILFHCYTHLSSSFIAIHTSHPPSLLHTSHPPSLLYTPLIFLHCYTYLSSSFIATYLSSSFIATHPHHPSLLYVPLILLHCYTHLSSYRHLPLFSPSFLVFFYFLIPPSSPSPLLQHNNTLFHTCLYRTGMDLPEPGLSPVHRVFWGPQDARVTYLSRSISCIGRVDTRADS